MNCDELLNISNPGKTCFDCLHCKVSSKSKMIRLCYCNKTKIKERHKDSYWLTRSVCRKFDDMSLDA